MPNLNLAGGAAAADARRVPGVLAGDSNPRAAEAAAAREAMSGAPSEDGSGDQISAHLNEGVPRDEFAHFIGAVADGGGDGVVDGDIDDDPELTADEEKWIQEQIANDEKKRGRAAPPMLNLKATLDEMDEEMEHWMNAVEPDPATPRLAAPGMMGGTAGPPTPRSVWPPQQEEGGSTLVRGTPRSQARHDDETKRYIDLSDPHGRCYKKAEFVEFYGGTQEFEAAKKAAEDGIDWEVVWPNGTAWRRAPEWDAWAGDGDEFFVPKGTTGRMSRMQNGFLCDEKSKMWMPLSAPPSGGEPGPQLVLLRPASAAPPPRQKEERRIAPDGVAYTKQQFLDHYKSTAQWESARQVPESAAPAAPAAASTAGPTAGSTAAASATADPESLRGKAEQLDAQRQALAAQLRELEAKKRGQHADPTA